MINFPIYHIQCILDVSDTDQSSAPTDLPLLNGELYSYTGTMHIYVLECALLCIYVLNLGFRLHVYIYMYAYVEVCMSLLEVHIAHSAALTEWRRNLNQDLCTFLSLQQFCFFTELIGLGES